MQEISVSEEMGKNQPAAQAQERKSTQKKETTDEESCAEEGIGTKEVT